jgi:hypothetical protein
MFKLTQTILTKLRSNNANVSVMKCEKYLKSTIAEAKNTQPNVFETEMEEEQGSKLRKYVKSHNSMVAAVFASLRPSNQDMEIKTPLTDDKISKATNIDELLSISEGTGISRRHALKVVSTLAEWSATGKARLADFESDFRFIKLCRILSKGGKLNRNMSRTSEDLSTILNVTADDEAARLVANLTLDQSVKVMTTLTMRKRRSVSLLRSLAYNITANCEQLDLKQSADLLYSMCTLNFVDENLLTKICADVINELTTDVRKSSVIGSVVTSLGLLKYKNCEVLDTLSEWILDNSSMCRIQDVFSLFVTLATVNHLPSNYEKLFQALLPQLSMSEARKPLVWLNFVWSLVVLNQATPDHVSSVLAQDFVNKIEGSKSSNVFAKVKLLNINGAAVHLLKNYDGPTLDPLSSVHTVNMAKTKEKTEMVEAIMDTLKNLIHSENHLGTNVNTNLGFSIDAKCLLDKKCNPLAITEENERRTDVTKIAVMGYDYHNMCRGKVEPTGANVLACNLLEAQNYTVLNIPYTEFKITDKLVHRVQYLENKLKYVVK